MVCPSYLRVGEGELVAVGERVWVEVELVRLVVVLMEEDDGLGSQEVDADHSCCLRVGSGYLSERRMVGVDEVEEVELALLVDLVVFGTVMASAHG